MRSIYILIVISITVSTNLFGQSFGEIGTEWYYSESAGGSCPGNCEYLHLESVSDTLISGYTTHKIAQTYYRYGGDTTQLDPIYLYEQSDTVYMYNFLKSKFQTLYIFNGNQGDTLILDAPYDFSGADTTYRLVIDTVINFVVDGIQLKKYGTKALDDFEFYFENGFFMDRVGGLDWFFPRAAIIPEAGGPIRCYVDAQIDTSFQTVDCDYILLTSIYDYKNSYDVKVYPNPTSDFLIIESDQSVENVYIFDLTGKLKMTTNELNIDVSKFLDGQYIMTINLINGQKIDIKVVKNSR